MTERTDRPAYAVYRLLWQSLDWLFPPLCGGCERPGSRWCENCQSTTTIIGDDICPKCGNLLPGENACPNCASLSPSFVLLRSWAIYQGPLREAIHRLKYQQDVALGEYFSRPMIQFLEKLGWNVNLVLPVPLSKERRHERGYNQAGLLAQPLALALNLPYYPKAIERWRDTTSQVGLSAGQRLTNVSGAFKAAPNLVKGRSILVIDDVTTTGATINACSEALLQAGAREVFALTLARAAHASVQPLQDN
jgi:competence protein ComFC